MILEISQTIWLDTPRGKGTAKFLIDRGDESDLQWIVFHTETREIWTYANHQVRTVTNETMDRLEGRRRAQS